MNKKNFRKMLPGSFRARRQNGASGTGTEALREEIRRLERSVETLSILNDLALAMSRAADPEEAVETLVGRSMRAVDAEQATVTLLDRPEASSMETQIRVVRSSAEHQSFHVNEGLVGWMLLHNKPLQINDPGADERFRGLSWDETIRSVMCVPLLFRSKLTGVLTIYNKKSEGGFTPDDERLMSIIAAQSAQIIEHARLAQEKNRMEEQLKLANDIQTNLLPKSPPAIDGYEVAGRSIPAQTVGGDYFDFIPIADGKLAVCLGDVSGKGLPASLLMANLQATLRGQTLVDAPVRERIGRANKLLCECTDDERFVTLFYGLLDPASHEFVYCSAGHERPFLFAGDGTSRRLESGGLALGVLETFEYEQDSIALAPGDLIVVYSDGITDAANGSQEQFGEARLEALIAGHRDKPVDVLVERIIEGVGAHAAGAPQFDDLTLVVVRRTRRSTAG